MKTLDISGRIFSEWMVSSESRIVKEKTEWLCICSCRRKQWVRANNLLNSGSTKCNSCSHKKPDSALKRVFNYYRCGAKKRNIEFLLTLADFKIICFMPCHYCGRPPSNTISSQQRYKENQITYSGIDRKNNSLGYALENSVSCCKDCNYSKGTKSIEDFILHCKKVSEYSLQ